MWSSIKSPGGRYRNGVPTVIQARRTCPLCELTPAGHLQKMFFMVDLVTRVFCNLCVSNKRVVAGEHCRVKAIVRLTGA